MKSYIVAFQHCNYGLVLCHALGCVDAFTVVAERQFKLVLVMI